MYNLPIHYIKPRVNTICRSGSLYHNNIIGRCSDNDDDKNQYTTKRNINEIKNNLNMRKLILYS